MLYDASSRMTLDREMKKCILTLQDTKEFNMWVASVTPNPSQYYKLVVEPTIKATLHIPDGYQIDGIGFYEDSATVITPYTSLKSEIVTFQEEWNTLQYVQTTLQTVGIIQPSFYHISPRLFGKTGSNVHTMDS